MSIALFAIIGATIEAGVWYWICFSGYCFLKFIKLISKLAKLADEW